MKLRSAIAIACVVAMGATVGIGGLASATAPAPVAGSQIQTFSSSTSLCGITTDDSGNVYTADGSTGAVYELPGGTGSPVSLGSVTADGSYQSIKYHDGFLYVTAWATSAVYRLDLSNVGAGFTAFITAGLNHPQDMAWDAAGNIYVTNYSGSVVVSTASSAGGTATDLGVTGLAKPEGILILGSTIYLLDNVTYQLFTVPLAGQQAATPNTTLPTMQYPWYLAANSAGDLFVDDLAHGIVVVPVDGSTPYWMTTTGVTLSYPTGIVWHDSNLYVGDYAAGTYSANLVYKLDVSPLDPTTTTTTTTSTTTTSGAPVTTAHSTSSSVTVSSGAVLATTGLNTLMLGGLGAALLLLGIAGTTSLRRRVHRPKPQTS